MSEYFIASSARATFASGSATKVDLCRGGYLFVGLNCFEPGQSQQVHTHTGADKFYVVLSGKARMVVGGESRVVGAGAVVWAPADVPHGVAEALERTILLAAIAPAPSHSAG